MTIDTFFTEMPKDICNIYIKSIIETIFGETR